jgi:hypothetical protein
MKIFDDKFTKIDYITLGFIAFQLFILIFNWNYLPTAELDTPYHLLMGKMFSDYDTVMLWDYYEYAPTGRPNLYPPLEHVLIWFMHDLSGADWWDIGRFISIIQYPLPLLGIWFFCKKLFSPVVALASVVFLSVSGDFWFWQVSVAPTALILSLFPFFLYSFYKRKVVTSIVLLSSFLYLHLGLPYIVILSIFIFSVLSLYKTRAYIKQFAVVTGISTLIFLPWIIHIFMYRDWLKLGAPAHFDPLSLFVGINILTIVFFVIGLARCFEKARIDLKYLLILSAFIGFLTIALYGWRYRMHSPIINCIVAGIGIEAVYAMILSKPTVSRRKIAAAVLLFLIPLGVFSLNLAPFSQQGQLARLQPQMPQNQPQQQLPQPQMPQNPQQNQPLQPRNQPQHVFQRPPVTIQRAPLLEMFNSLRTGTRPPRVWQITNPEIDDLIQWVADNTSPDEILHLNNGMLANYLALFTDRRTDAGMYREVTTPELFQAVHEGKKSGIFIVEAEEFRKQRTTAGMTILEQFGNLVILQGMKPEVVPREISFHLEGFFILLQDPDSKITAQWIDTITHVQPRRVYIGISQKNMRHPELQRFIDELHPVCDIGLAIIVEDVDKSIVLPSHVTALRLIMSQEKISFTYIEAVRSSLPPHVSLEIAVLGPPIYQNRKVSETLRDVLPLVDRVVRHVPPNVEFIHAVQEEQQLLGEPLFIQIDTERGQIELKPEELYMLLHTAQQIVGNNIIIEFAHPPAQIELLDFLRKVYAV